jgi:predicted O-methyltransferase YrrM
VVLGFASCRLASLFSNQTNWLGIGYTLNVATVGSVLSVLSLLPQGRALDFVDRVMTSIELRLHERRTRVPSYETAGWEETVEQLERFFGQAAGEILAEPALREIEGEVQQRLEEIRQDSPFHLAYNADIALAQSCYLVCRLLKPAVVMETGVAYGTSSAFILKALQQNGHGALHSIDVVASTNRDAFRFIGALVPEELRSRWSLHFGASRRVMPKLLWKLGRVDLFIHDSLHTYWNMRREFATVWPYLSEGGAIMSDDVHRNQAFGELRERGVRLWRVVQETRKDYASFGIALK